MSLIFISGADPDMGVCFTRVDAIRHGVGTGENRGQDCDFLEEMALK
jgi:hypothetical protein